MKIPPIIIACIFFTSLLYAQNSASESNYYTWYDAIVGIENTPLFNGVEYIEGYKTTRENHKFFINQSFYEGRVDYDGQSYYNISLKYDIYEDELIANLESEAQKSLLQLIKSKVAQFTIGTHTFINVTDREAQNNGIEGFHERLAENNLGVFYKKHRKRRVKKEDKRILYFEFFDTKSDYVILMDGTYHWVNSKNDFYELFPEIKKELKSFLNANDALRRSDKEQQLKALFNKASQMLNAQNPAP
ncbi:hypothetical protein POV27_11880 [Aureisphaera galaxeae]|uniref:hypothetical protein n=1 Tax=Aureisphaera galaxeae TaxID=1538023 RepID=UPI002350E562|nr:hypothetical protein [Aureisphaera galaxeae]MDC8004753.1 hypothetical protein [Aureisphaera galaxeae]